MNKSASVHIKDNPLDKFQQDNKSKPYHGYRRNCGMPSAREPVNSYKRLSRDNFDKIFGHSTDLSCNNQKNVTRCTQECMYNAPKHQSNCILYASAVECGFKLEPGYKKKKIIEPDYTPPLKGVGSYDGEEL